ncbi:EF-P lysine aminoacylase EpmA [Marinimicrobium agarilyticum]|uniref:EF-P lysine aminoacylase EpmA n=1 Tax=Marinimicrobium agarilyticum TaxID=306546 RepID=UPI0004048A23|nr:EF-P lysine aminoacylase EpmA [Marinimicrobium agarilyticum]
MNDWQPSASIEQLRQRARLYRQVRAFFTEREVMEIEAPVMGAATVTDPFIDSVTAQCAGRSYYLQTSPEFAMKRLLAAGAGAIYSLGKVFRNGERGRKHNPEFTLLEWYRPGWNDHQLMREVEALVLRVLPGLTVTYLSYREWFERHLGLDPHRATAGQLAALARERINIEAGEEDRDFWLDLLVTHELEATLGPGLTFVYDYPESQAALARLATDAEGQTVARRFEAFIGSMELANGYWELTDASEQRRRFEADQDKRRKLGLPQYPVDEKLLAAIDAGLPDSAGVALGMDRLLMCLTGASSIAEVLAFDVNRL